MIRIGEAAQKVIDRLNGLRAAAPEPAPQKITDRLAAPEPAPLTKPIYRDPVLRWQQGEWIVVADEYHMEEMVEPFLTVDGSVIMKEARHLRRREKIMYRGKDREKANETLVELEEAARATRLVE